jgi:hypothetical protein
MIDVALSLFALVAGGVTLELFSVRTPMGTHEERLGNESLVSPEEFQIGNPS